MVCKWANTSLHYIANGFREVHVSVLCTFQATRPKLRSLPDSFSGTYADILGFLHTTFPQSEASTQLCDGFTCSYSTIDITYMYMYYLDIRERGSVLYLGMALECWDFAKLAIA